MPDHTEDIANLIFQIFQTLSPDRQAAMLDRLGQLADIDETDFAEMKQLEMALSPSEVQRIKAESKTPAQYLDALRAAHEAFIKAIA
jgi:phosphopantetheinyl transferase (holo-ACP synthase)